MKLNKENIPFTMVANEVLYRKDLSMNAKGMFAYLFSKPEGWEFSADRIALECKEGRKGVLTMLKELVNVGLLNRVRLPSGKMNYNIKYTDSQSPHKGLRVGVDITTQKISKPKSPSGTVPVGHGAERGSISNKEIDSKKEEEMKKVVPVSFSGSLVNEIIDMFKAIDPSYDRNFSRVAERQAVERMLARHGVEKVRQAVMLAIKVAPIDKYSPKLTKPTELENGMVKLKLWVETHAGRGAAITSI